MMKNTMKNTSYIAVNGVVMLMADYVAMLSA